MPFPNLDPPTNPTCSTRSSYTHTSLSQRGTPLTPDTIHSSPDSSPKQLTVHEDDSDVIDKASPSGKSQYIVHYRNHRLKAHSVNIDSLEVETDGGLARPEDGDLGEHHDQFPDYASITTFGEAEEDDDDDERASQFSSGLGSDVNDSDESSEFQYSSQPRMIQQPALRRRRSSIRKSQQDRFSLMTSHLYRIADSRGWFRDSTFASGAVAIRIRRRKYRTFPVASRRDPLAKEFTGAIGLLNPEAVIKITSKVVTAILSRLPLTTPDIALSTNTRLQVLSDISHLAGARKHQFGAFVTNERCLVVWADDVDVLIENVEALEKEMIRFVWQSRDFEFGHIEKTPFLTTPPPAERLSPNDKVIDTPMVTDIEKGMPQHTRRPVMLFAPLLSGLAVIIDLAFVGAGFRTVIVEILLDSNYIRIALAVTVPFSFLLALFFCTCVVGNFWQMLGPVAHCHDNSSYYSGKAPPRTLNLSNTDGTLPAFTIQMPVYKEGLEGVIIPTVESLKKAITTYERQGGSVSILVCDDGLQLWSPEEAEVRKSYYDRNAIGWVARPGHNKDGYIRKGRFKKASNMNFACKLSLRVEEIMDEIRAPLDPNDPSLGKTWTDADEQQVYEKALQQATDEMEGRAWAAGNIRIGEYILIIDSDTRVPEDCFLDAANELRQSPDIAIIQHESDVMMVISHYFENGIAHFTRRINKAISFCCANGEVAPFVGHNAFLRWSAIQEVSFVDEDDGVKKVWSETHVSEDFDMSLRLQMKGYSLRWATYSNGGFKEGVSLTCDDELNRWQKYAYGCSELLFWPLKSWIFHGPITPLFKKFLWASIPLHSKVSVVGYISSYYAIAAAALLSMVNWFITGLFNESLDGFYLASWEVFLTCIVVFVGLSNISSSVFAYRLKEEGFAGALWSNFKWIFFFFFFFCGMPWHLSNALVAHLICYNMTWGSTIKEVDVSNFFKEVPRILERFWFAYLYGFVCIAAIAIFASHIVPEGWRIQDMTSILPAASIAGCHILYPIVLNPWLMHFHF